ncbi:MAG: DUF2695 domain-containing protein [Verrucomicrobiota bacterium]
MASKKEQRRLAIEREQQRRNREAIDACPISRDAYTSLVDYVTDQIVDHGHSHDFSITTEYLEDHDHPVEEMISFLATKRITDDWSLLVSGDPIALFGATAERSARMPLEEDQLESLIEWLDAEVQSRGCDHGHPLTREWLERHGIAPTRTIGALMALGGFCDCEVALNVDTNGIYPKSKSEQPVDGNPY